MCVCVHANACVYHPCALWVEVIKLLVNNHLVDRLIYSTCLSVYPSMQLSICLSMQLSISMQLSVYPSMQPSIHLSMQLSIYLSIYATIYLSIYLCNYLSIYLSNQLSIYLSMLSIYLSKKKKSTASAFASRLHCNTAA